MKKKFEYKNEYLDNNYYINNKYNYYFLKRKIIRNNNIFLNNKIKDNYIVRNNLLDNNQKEAVFSNEENTLVLASAGSGKTLTIEGKIKYLIEEKHIKEDEILCISFTNETVNNLKNRLNYNIDIFTFHKLSLEILKDYNLNITVAGNYLSYIINEIFLSIVKNINEKMLDNFNNIITNFINLYKNNNYDDLYFDKLIKKNKNKLLEVCQKIYYIYQEELKSSNYVDFNDMINLAYKMIKERGFKRYYKYIIIDEFQDISINRLNLIKIIKETCNSKVFTVGDDYQSIYKFSGSNINFIRKFKRYFGYTKIIKINNTYRNSNELIKVTTNFILKNKNQVKKIVKSNKSLYKPIKIIYYQKNMSIKLEKLLEFITDDVLILGRNNYDIDNLSSKIKDKHNCKTIHKSKGLESESVIIINLNNKFPKKVNNINDLLLEKEKYLYEEERRLFYVALTRTKSYVYLLVDKNNPSIFVDEIIRKNKKYIEVLDL